ncbi:hypothetical protein SU69_08355 [Thermosipho melanesiensis]|uniref:ABC transmembrane type-1 domain-containing protein n=2 Tax=Thermosipho melanesiensis TaxID=46541 RepID=A6LNJ0_THEM4|nr:ABC transporter transmembrane domain-containing protein [Thermosipho melanesiensis]ABR31491.1 hypothetical protein Tmel_1647 [Thermosipho melanesiensis BI429]APT74548.1 hypothetical protein BW47_08715 [Thermosipho melanesiensis]OOC36498.1 hypothetical protein SU68_08425 [Thermosipho melanesiensis]OOC37316.1 hypothetical protein SU69_08355 [Thermosipho melanesiensis]OOC38069.1 hypothetical protein SU70_08365 [Thermosipho melanesiensis]
MKNFLKWIFKVPRKVIIMLVSMNIFGIISSFLISYSAILSRDIINYAISKDKDFAITGLLYVIAIISSHVLLVIGKSFVSFVKGRYLKYLGEYSFQKIMKKDFTNFSKKSPAFYSEITLRTTENMLNIISDYENTGGLVFAFKITFYMFTMYTLDKFSGFLMIIFAILILTFLAIANKFFYKNYKLVQDEFLNMKSYVSDMFSGIEEIILFESQEFEIKNFKNNFKKTWDKLTHTYKTDYFLTFFTRDIISTTFYLLIIYRGIQLSNVGTFFALTNLFALIKYHLLTSVGLWDNFREAIISAKQLSEIVE